MTRLLTAMLLGAAMLGAQVKTDVLPAGDWTICASAANSPICKSVPPEAQNYMVQIQEPVGTATNLYSYSITATLLATGKQITIWGFYARSKAEANGLTVTAPIVNFGGVVTNIHTTVYCGLWTLEGVTESIN